MTGTPVKPGSGFVLRHSFVIRYSSFVITPMSEPASNAELMRSLGKLVRGLSALFWGLPLTLVVCFHIAKAETLKSYHILPPIACTGLLVYGLWLLGAFQKHHCKPDCRGTGAQAGAGHDR